MKIENRKLKSRIKLFLLITCLYSLLYIASLIQTYICYSSVKYKVFYWITLKLINQPQSKMVNKTCIRTIFFLSCILRSTFKFLSLFLVSPSRFCWGPRRRILSYPFSWKPAKQRRHPFCKTKQRNDRDLNRQPLGRQASVKTTRPWRPPARIKLRCLRVENVKSGKICSTTQRLFFK